jgi:RNA polymerase sigma-70 factor (ECF subfamily)
MTSAPAPRRSAPPADLRHEIAALVPELRAFARFLVRERAMADDLVQDTIVRALDALPQFTPGTSLRNWLFAILRNTLYEQTRRRRIEQRLIAQAGPPEEFHPAAQPGQAALAELQRFLFVLPANLREALVLVGAQGLSYAEAAEICGVAEGTMKARVSRARAQLARSMDRSVAADPELKSEPDTLAHS